MIEVDSSQRVNGARIARFSEFPPDISSISHKYFTVYQMVGLTMAVMIPSLTILERQTSQPRMPEMTSRVSSIKITLSTR